MQDPQPPGATTSMRKGRRQVPSPPPRISREELRARQERCRHTIRDEGFDAVLVVGGPFYDRVGDLAYLTGHYPPFPTVNFDGDYRGLGYGAILMPVRGGTVLVSDTPAYREERIAADDVRPTRNVATGVRQAIADLGLSSSTIAFIGSEVAPWALVREMTEGHSLTLTPADHVLRTARRQKSPAEVELLRHAAHVAEEGMNAALEAIRPGATESEVGAIGIEACMARGADFVRYLRVLSGPYSGWPHRWPPATTRTIEEGETVCMDLIGAVGGYQFDILRAAVAGQDKDGRGALMDVAAESTSAAIQACGPGIPVRDVVAASDEVLRRAGQLEHRAAFTGHGIGLDTVEGPLIMATSDATLEAGDVICLEPGILQRGVTGARFEYEIHISEHGADVLAGTP